MVLFLVSPNPRAAILENSNGDIFGSSRDGSSDLLRVWFQDGVFGVGGSNGAISGFAKSKMVENSNGDISAADHPIYSVFGSTMGFLGSAD